MPKADEGKRSFGTTTKLPSGRYQARYTGPDGQRHKAHTTFEDIDAARSWLRNERRYKEETPASEWRGPAERAATARARGETFGEFAERWLRTRRVKGGQPLAGRTRDHYQDLLDRFILPTFGDRPLASITSDDIDDWFDDLPDRPTYRAHAYGLLRTILATAVDKDKIATQPARYRGAGRVERSKKIEPATLAQVAIIVGAMPERRRLMITLATWTGLRFGELAELRRKDIHLKGGFIDVSRGVVRVRRTDAAGNVSIVREVKKPKTAAGERRVFIPPHILNDVRDHLFSYAAAGPDGLLFPAADGNQLSPAAFYGRETTFTKTGAVKTKGHGFYEARRSAGRRDLHFHALRHTALTHAAQAGATLAELMEMAGHTTSSAALRYQHAAKDRMKDLAARLSQIADAEASEEIQ